MLATILNATVLVTLLTACTALFILHSLYFIFRYAENTTQSEIKEVVAERLQMPALVICNRMPFSQDGINSINSNIREENSIRYLREWTDPSLMERADFFPAPSSSLQRGADILAQYMPSLGRNSTIQRMQYDCQSVISTCSYQGVQLSSYDCCKDLISTSLAGPVGICWLLHDRSMVQNSTSPFKQLAILFQIPRNSWYADYMRTHPGVDVYLIEGGTELAAVEQYLENPIHLRDKRGVRLKINKESRALTRRPACGQSLGDARRADRSNAEHNRTGLLLCHIVVSVKYCGCHPIMGDLMTYDRQQFREFTRLMEGTNVCGVEQYEGCSRRYVDLARGDNEDVPRDLRGWKELEDCKDQNERRCVFTSYPGHLDEYDLPEEYQNSRDFIARLVLQYDTMRVTEVLESKDPNLYEMLSYVGYNLALWFCVGHILWSVYAFARDVCCTSSSKRSAKVVPEEATGEDTL